MVSSDRGSTRLGVPIMDDGLLSAPPPPRRQVGCSRLDRQDRASQHTAQFTGAQPCIAGLHRLYIRAVAGDCRRPRQHLHAGGECLAEAWDTLMFFQGGKDHATTESSPSG
jgi:hypothetical protein